MTLSRSALVALLAALAAPASGCDWTTELSVLKRGPVPAIDAAGEMTRKLVELAAERERLRKLAEEAERVRLAEAAAKPPPPCPDGMAHLGRTCIDRYEAHLVVATIDGKLEPHPHHDRPPAGVHFEARSSAGAMPQAYISRDEAAFACKNAGKRLCNWLEWRRACQGPRWLTYPYGWREKRGACNTRKTHLLHELFGDGPWKYEEHFNSPEVNQQPGFLAKGGDHKECNSSDGIYDMVGNLHEWVSTRVTESFVESLEAEPFERIEQHWTEGNGMFLGGFFSTADQHGPGCHYTTIAHEPSYHDYSTGFRCCANARPSEEDKQAKKRR